MIKDTSRSFSVSARVQPAALALLVKYYKGQGGVKSASEVVSRAVADLARVLEESGLALPVTDAEVEGELRWLKGGKVTGKLDVKEHTLKRLFKQGRATEMLGKEA